MLCRLTLHTPKRHSTLIRTLLHAAPSRAYASAAKSKLKSPATQTDTAEPAALKAASPTETGTESSPNQLVIDKVRYHCLPQRQRVTKGAPQLTELRALHAANGRPDDKWRVLTYDKGAPGPHLLQEIQLSIEDGSYTRVALVRQTPRVRRAGAGDTRDWGEDRRQGASPPFLSCAHEMLILCPRLWKS
jgi:hypothetical protein